MVKTLLVALDGTADGEAALSLGIEWARRHEALLVGLVVVDEPGLHYPEERILGEAPHFRKIDQRLLRELTGEGERVLGAATLRCAREGVPFKPLEVAGSPCDRICREAERYDLILLGRESLREGFSERPDDALTRILRRSPRPVVVVPSGCRSAGAVLIAYDGSLQAARTLQAFEASGLIGGRAVHVVSVHEDPREAARRAGRAVEFLSAHRIEAAPVIVSEPGGADPASVMLAHAETLDAGLLVMGVYGQSALRELFLGSTTRTMLREAPVPLFVWH
ncbi:MAG: universal stress protein [Isosphaeraceae bacterium]